MALRILIFAAIPVIGTAAAVVATVTGSRVWLEWKLIDRFAAGMR